jgi:protease-4
MPSILSRRIVKKEKSQHPILKWFGRFLMGLGALMLISMTLSIISIIMLFSGGNGGDAAPLPNKFVLYHNMLSPLADKPQTDSLVNYLANVPPPTTLMDFSNALHQAKTDDRVTHFVMRINDGEYSLTQIQSMRRMITDFRESSGKKAIAISDNFGNMSSGLGEYWLATAFDKIWLEPLGIVSLTGIYVETPFFEEALGNIGVEFQMEKRKDYKTGAEPFIRNAMSEEGAEALNDIFDDVMQTITTDIMTARGLTEQQIYTLIDNSPLLDGEAMAQGLVDHIEHSHEINDYLEDIINYKNDDVTYISINRYARQTRPEIKDTPKVAVVPVEGMILDDPLMSKGQGIGAFINPSNIAEATTIRNQILSLAENDNVKVIILRVNSPGGSPTASEVIRGAVEKAKAEGKYIIVSMGDTAASGGYWLAVNADHIIASPFTVTGSIGVYGGKPNLDGLWDKIGLNWTTFEYGQNASMWSVNEPYSESERKRLNVMMDSIYDSFINRVAEGREMSRDNVEAAAKGRAWIGTDALENGLIDQLGDFEAALQHTAYHLEIMPDEWRDMPYYFVMDKSDPIDELKSLLGLPTGVVLPIMPYSILMGLFPEATVVNPTHNIKL